MLTAVKAYGFPAAPLVLPLESEDSPFQILDIQGLGPVKANINTVALTQTEFFVGSSLPKRNIVITLGLNPDWSQNQTYDNLRDQLEVYFMPQQPIRLRFERDPQVDVEISGYVEGCEENIFSPDPEYQVSIICPDSDYLAIAPRQVIGGGATPLAVQYGGSRPAGFLLTIQPNPQDPLYYKGWNLRTDRPANDFHFGGQVDTSRIVELSTVRGDKFIRSRVPSTGVIRNLLSTIPSGTRWPELQPGENVFQLLNNGTGQPWFLRFTERFGSI